MNPLNPPPDDPLDQRIVFSQHRAVACLHTRKVLEHGAEVRSQRNLLAIEEERMVERIEDAV